MTAPRAPRLRPVFGSGAAWWIGLVTWVLGGMILWDDHLKRTRTRRR